MAVGGCQLVFGGGWRLAVGGPQRLSLRALLNKTNWGSSGQPRGLTSNRCGPDAKTDKHLRDTGCTCVDAGTHCGERPAPAACVESLNTAPCRPAPRHAAHPPSLSRSYRSTSGSGGQALPAPEDALPQHEAQRWARLVGRMSPGKNAPS